MRQSNPNFACWHLQRGACQETVQALALNSNRHMKIVSLLSSNYVQEAQYSNFQMWKNNTTLSECRLFFLDNAQKYWHMCCSDAQEEVLSGGMQSSPVQSSSDVGLQVPCFNLFHDGCCVMSWRLKVRGCCQFHFQVFFSQRLEEKNIGMQGQTWPRINNAVTPLPCNPESLKVNSTA